MKQTRYIFPIAALLFGSVSVGQAEPYLEQSIPLDWALELAQTASETCHRMGFSTTVTVVDQRGQMRVQLLREGAFPHTVQTSHRKALTAASRRTATSEIAEQNRSEPTLGDMFHEIGMTVLSGGVPIHYGDAIIGGIGVAGAPGENEAGAAYDELCINAGLQVIAKNLAP